ncbi:MAG TPA: hypothetical protein V6D28_01960 [Leptolyngbyaceae cyanobacterium]
MKDKVRIRERENYYPIFPSPHPTALAYLSPPGDSRQASLWQ